MNALHTALELNAKGIGVIPIKPMSKLPAIPTWKEYQEVKPTFSQLLKWFSGNDLNIAVLCGPVSNGLCILDFDSEQAYVGWMVKNPQYRDTFSVSTSRGRHLYFFCEELPEKTFKLEGIDVKSTGYCLTYGSIHPSGVTYQVINDQPIMRIKDLNECGLTPNIDSASSPVIVNYGTINNYGTMTIAHTNIRCLGGTDILSKIKADYPIASLFESELYPTGDDKYLAHCPGRQHTNGDIHPSLVIDKASNRCQCFNPGCEYHSRRGNSVIDAYMIKHGVSLKRAIAELANQLGF